MINSIGAPSHAGSGMLRVERFLGRWGEQMKRTAGFPYIVFTAFTIYALAALLCGQPARADAPDETAAKAYIAGIEDLQRADYGGAVQALSQACLLYTSRCV